MGKTIFAQRLTELLRQQNVSQKELCELVRTRIDEKLKELVKIYDEDIKALECDESLLRKKIIRRRSKTFRNINFMTIVL